MMEVCGNRKHNKRNFDRYCNVKLCCDNEESDEYGVSTMYDDSCDCWEEKD